MKRSTFYIGVLLVAATITGGSWTLRRLLMGLPDIRTLEDYTPPISTRVFDAKGTQIAEFSIEKRALLPLNKIPVDLQNAVIAAEDDGFFTHWGISPKGIVRAALRNLRAGRVVQGASTITQQLSKQIFLRPERKLTRKVREALLAIQIERNFSKTEILQYYLNQVYFGEGAYGVQSAARIYFAKETSELTLADCAMLAGLIRAPNGNSPFRHPENARKRKAIVLQRMVDEKLISPADRDLANAEPVPLEKPVLAGTQAPYFVEHVRSRLERKYGYDTLWRGGLKIHTTLDLEMQKIAEERMEKALIAFDEKALKEWEKKQKEQQEKPIEGVELSTIPPAKVQGAFVLLDVKSGAIRAMIGGRDSIFNRATQSRRQPGSTFKPFVWAAALQTGMTAASLIEDNPLAYYFDGRDWRLLEGATDQYSIDLATQPFASNPDFKIWVPQNFDGKFYGTVSLRRALAASRNIASINLINKIGPPLVVELAHKVGIVADLDPVPSLGLGSSVVTVLEVTNAIGTFANGGIHVQPYTVLRVEDNSGKQLQTHVPQEREAVTPQLAYLMTTMLKAVVQSGTAARARALGRPLAGKTGTSNDNKDAWFIGATPDFVAGAWMGYDDFTSLGHKDWTGGSTVVPWWTEIMTELLKDYPKRDFPTPSGISFHKIDGATGQLAGPTCPKKSVLLEAFQDGTEPTEYCSVDHAAPLEQQLVGGAVGAAVDPLALTTSTNVVVEPGDAPPPLPTDEELGAQPEGGASMEAPVILE